MFFAGWIQPSRTRVEYTEDECFVTSLQPDALSTVWERTQTQTPRGSKECCCEGEVIFCFEAVIVWVTGKTQMTSDDSTLMDDNILHDSNWRVLGKTSLIDIFCLEKVKW